MNPKHLASVSLAWFAAGPHAQEPPVEDGIRAEARALIEALADTGALAGGEAEARGGQTVDRAELDEWAAGILADAFAAAADGAAPPASAGPPAPVPADSHSAGPARANTAEVIVFASLSMPESAWRQWSAQAARLGVPLVLRGVAPGGLAATARRMTARHAGAGAAVDPRLFRLFGIALVPAVAVVPGGVPPCRSAGCSADAPPPFDVVAGNVGLENALEIVAREGGPGRAAARRHLDRLRRENP